MHSQSPTNQVHKRARKMEIAKDATHLDDKALNRFSRQNAALGAETTAKLIKMKILIYGLRGVGAETSKNLALQGAGGLTIVDSNSVEAKDIGVNFFFQPNDIGKSRTDVMVPKLRELNPLCSVASAKDITEALIKSHSAVVITQPMPLSRLIEFNEICRVNSISFFYCDVSGVFLDIFVDHGINHTVFDFDGERPIQKLITDVTPINESECLIRYETPEGQQAISISKGHYEVSEVQGIDGMNGSIFPVSRNYADPVKTVRAPYAFKNGNGYQGGGLLTEKKLPTPYPMQSLAEKMFSPGNTFAEPPTLVLTDLINFGAELQQHVAFYATFLFEQEFHRLPVFGSEEDIEAVFQLAKKLVAEKKVDLEDFEVDETFVKKYAKYSSIELQAISAFAGGVLAQEVVKATGKFTPIPGFMHFNALESLPDKEQIPSFENSAPKNDRNDELAAVYGWDFVDQLKKLKYFMVGCGALGCEFMKNFALNGVCCSAEGKLVVTDADRIELSNLSRQFLFREHNVGQPKSRAAAAMAKVMNQDFNVEALEVFVGAKSENLFNDQFWLGLDGVCNALDNIEARLYVDKQCVKYEKSLLESGTMGTNGNVDTICPFKTRTYGEGGNAAEGGGVPMCTLRNFPHLTDHCIEWARDQFELLFTKLGKSLESYLKSPAEYEHKILDKAGSEPGAAFFDVRSLTSFAKLAANPSIGKAAQVAFDIFHFLFRDKILDLQNAFPKDYRIIDEKTKQDKGPFWGEKKRYPTVAVFNPNDDSHLDFLLSTTCLLSVCVGLISPKQEGDDSWLKEYRSRDWIMNISSGLSLPPYIPAPVNSEGMENAPTMDKAALQSILTTLLDDLKSSSGSLDFNRTFEPADFEKDDDLNFHISFVTSSTNLRCDNYSIKRTDFHGCKVIAGRIIPAIATTTAAVCGLVMLELFKVVLKKDTEAYMNRAIGLGGNSYTSFTAEKPNSFKTSTTVEVPENLPQEAYNEKGVVKEEFCDKVVKRAYPEGHSVWDKLVCNADMTLAEFCKWLLEEHGLKIQSWNFIYGYRNVVDEHTKQKQLSPVTSPVYPPKPILDYALIPSLDLTLAQATTALMKSPAARQMQQYLALWREFKVAGTIPAQPPITEATITDKSTIRQILVQMTKISEEALANGLIETTTISNIASRKFVLLSSSETPSCIHAETGDDVEHLCAFKIMLE